MKTNIGTADRIARFLIALLSLGLYSRHAFSGITANVMLLFGMIMLVTAYFRFCPLYKIAGFSTYKPKTDFIKLMEDNAVIVDVRQPSEYRAAHIGGSINIPLEQLSSNLSKLAGKTVITCCASGMRSAAAKDILSAAGIKVFNGGGWKSLSKEFQSEKD
jgi:rhodanese-related sulfurtransferase